MNPVPCFGVNCPKHADCPNYKIIEESQEETRIATCKGLENHPLSKRIPLKEEKK